MVCAMENLVVITRMGALVAGAMAVGSARAVPLDLSAADSKVSGETTLRLDGVRALGSSYWGEFGWNERTNKFDVVGYGLMGLEDAQCPSVELLIPSDQSHGDTVVVDLSSDAREVSVHGDLHHSMDEPLFGSSALYFDGAGDYWSVAGSEDLNLGTGDFTLEHWILLPEGAPTTQYWGTCVSVGLAAR